MYIIIPASSPVPYRQLKSLSFAPEVDLTLSSLPVNEFRADIITEDSIETGSEAILKDDMDQLWADYTITKAERVSKQCVRIVAQSNLTLMDRWTLPAEMFQNVKVPTFISYLFRIPTVSGFPYEVAIDVDPYFNDVTVTGFCPEQTARERLQWLCVTVGAVVRQCFASALQFVPAPDVDPATYYAKGTLIPLADTYMKPSITVRELVRSVAVTGYENFTNVDPTPDPESMEPGDEPIEVIQWESSVDDSGVTWWYNPVDLLFENAESPELIGQQVGIDGVTLIGESSRQVIGWLSAAYFRRGEITLECVNNRRYYPGQKVRVYTDEETIYTGYIQSCDFTFGVQAKSRLVISSNLLPAFMGMIVFRYVWRENTTLGTKILYMPVDDEFRMEFPIIRLDNGGKLTAFLPGQSVMRGIVQGGRREYEIPYHRMDEFYRTHTIQVRLFWSNENDEDLHCIEENGEHIYYGHKVSAVTGGRLNTDITHPSGMAEENITYSNAENMAPGDYLFYVKTYKYRGGTNGFSGEIIFDNAVRRGFVYRNGGTSQDQETPICRMRVGADGWLEFENYLEYRG